jgi:hypothetical protein
MARTPDKAQSGKEQDEAPPQRRNWISPVGADARSAASTAFTRMGFRDPTLVLRWREIAGPEVARLAQPLKLTGDILTLRAAPGAALFLAHEKRTLCERINAFLGQPAVGQIKFSQAASPPPPRAKPTPQIPAHAVALSDPSRRYQGPDGLAKALQALARRR